MKILFKKLLCNFKTIQYFFLLTITLCPSKNQSSPSSLKLITHISQATNITFLSRFSEYKDISAYGELPNTLNIIDLNSLNSFVNWGDPSSFKILNPKELYVAKIDDASVSPMHLGTMFDHDQQYLFDLFVNPGNPIFWPLNNSIQNKPIIFHKKLATVQGPTFFYHWVIDRLPSVVLLKNLLINDPEIKLLINNTGTVHAYFYEYLELLGIPKDQIITANPNNIYHAETLYFATPFLMEPIPRKLLLKLREDLLIASNCSTVPTSNEKSVIIIQRKESDRKIANLKDLLALVKETFGEHVKIVIYDANMPVKDQIKLFNRADLVIGIMASGLTNILFVKPGTTIIEIHQTLKSLGLANGINKHGNEWCWWLSSAVNAHYWATTSDFKLSDSSVIAPLDQINKILLTIKKQWN